LGFNYQIIIYLIIIIIFISLSRAVVRFIM